MKAGLLLLISWFALRTVPVSGAEMPPVQTRLVTNLVEILQYVDAFSQTLDIDTPRPLSTNDVSQFRTVLGDVCISGMRISERFDFGFSVRHHLINAFVDRRYSMISLWRADDIKPLIRPSKINEKQALEMARQCLVKLGYTEDKLPPLLPPKVHQWEWKPPGARLGDPLPFFSIEWRWKKNPNVEYCTIEIDGFRQRITRFYIMYPMQDIFAPDPP